MGKLILDLCGGTGAWSKPYREAGYDVEIVTLPDRDVLTYHPPKGVYGVLAAPPCTMFSIARTTAKLPRDLVGAYEVVSACLRIIAECQYNGEWLHFWAMENPTGYLRKFMGKPAYSFKQWWFDATIGRDKPTDLWGMFNTPKRTIIDKPEFPRTAKGRIDGWQAPPVPVGYEQYAHDRAALRSITPYGFAKAFMKANP